MICNPMYHVYAIKDKKASYSTDLLLLQSDDLAKRHFAHLLSNLGRSTDLPLIIKFPEDFDLYRIGNYDPDTAVITPCDPCFICGASNFVVSAPDKPLGK